MNAYSSPRGVGLETSTIYGYNSIQSLEAGNLGPTRRNTVIKFARILDEESAKVKTPPKPKPADSDRLIRPPSQVSVKNPQTLERNNTSNQNLSRLSVLKKCDKDLKPGGKYKLGTKGNSAKVNYKCKFSSNSNDARETGQPTNLKVKDPASTVKSPASSRQSIKLNDIEKGFNKLTIKNRILSSCTDSNVIKNIRTHDKTTNCEKPKNVAPQKSPKPFTNVQSKVNTFLKKKQTPHLEPCKQISIPQHPCPLTMMSITSISRDPQPLFHISTEASHRGAQVRSDDFYVPTVDTSVATSHTAIEKPKTQNQSTETINTEACMTEVKVVKETEIQTEDTPEDVIGKDLCPPPLSLVKKNQGLSRVILENHSLPNLQVPPFKILSRKKSYDEIDNRNSSNNKSKSIIIGEATVTYTTQKKINFQVVGSADVMEDRSTIEPYPFSVMTILKKELNTKDEINKRLKESGTEKVFLKHKTEICKWPENIMMEREENFKDKELAKPSDIIRKIRGNDTLLNGDYFCEQFQKELNFIESFMDSLQYLENSWMSDTGTVNSAVQQQTELFQNLTDGQLESDILLSKFHHGELDTSQHIQMTANKSLCLLNLLIRDEQRRSKNLLFVLKMREDALKDFTKSQILWLENKKKTEDMDVSTLKKKQRGVLLKLQQECGEMQRMKKALLALSERRKAALIQTKRNIELKLSKGSQVDRILKSGKKKIRRPSPATSKPVRSILPLKCFDLSGSSCFGEDSLEKEQIEKLFSTSDTSLSNIMTLKTEKCIQTGNSIMEVKEELPKSSSQFVKVDGGYLNILFHNLALPEIFSIGKEYEVNESALQNILNSANRLQESLLQENNDTVEKYLNQGKTTPSQGRTPSKSSTPSTARSLIEEFEEYFQYLCDNDSPNKLTTPEKSCILLNTIEIQKETTVIYEGELHSGSTGTDPLESRNSSTSLELSCKESSTTSSKSSEPNLKDVELSYDDSKQHLGYVRGFEPDISDRKFPSLEISLSQSQTSTSAVKSNAVNVIKSTWSLQNSQSWTSGSQYSITSTSTDDSQLEERAKAVLLQSVSLPVLSEIDVLLQSVSQPALTEAELKPHSTLLPAPSEAEVKSQSVVLLAATEAENLPKNVSILTLPEERAMLTQSVSLPTLSEAEVLRKKQLAIELEIKALEQQQSQMFIVREIPDKPPPPYTPPSPAEPAPGPQASPPPSAGFSADKNKLAECINIFCQQHLSTNTASTTTSDLFKETAVQVTDSFLEFLNDFCDDGVNKYTTLPSDRPWSPSNLIPQRLSSTQDNVQKRIQDEVLQVLGCTPKAPLPGPELLNKRSDYIDDILFTEWRKCEPEWTNLEADEIAVKNQVFESIFEKVLEESIQEYKRIVNPQHDSDTDESSTLA